MKSNIFVCIGLFSFFLFGCSNHSDRKGVMSGENIIVQEEDGTISLELDNAACYSDVTDPSSNTAEWEMSITKPGRYKVWLSSATRDTLALKYANSVKIQLLDNQIEVIPICDKVIQNSRDISFPYYRADSYMGSFYIQEPGVYNIQVISEKVLSKEMRAQTASLTDTTRLLSVVLVPMTR